MAFAQKGALKEGRTIVFADQSSFYLLPAVVRTYLGGKDAHPQEHLSRDHLSVMSAITLEGKLYMTEQERAFKGEDVVRFLKHLLRQIPGKLLLPWQVAPNMGRLSDTPRRGGQGLTGQRGVQAA